VVPFREKNIRMTTFVWIDGGSAWAIAADRTPGGRRRLPHVTEKIQQRQCFQR
jgi:hypothetical protein